jgi:hypothetical protein
MLQDIFTDSISLIFTSPRYNWNIVERGVKHHNPNPDPLIFTHNKSDNAHRQPGDQVWLYIIHHYCLFYSNFSWLI